MGLNEKCSIVVLRKVSPKMKDPSKCTIPCLIGAYYFDKCLCDLGASTNLMPYFVFKKLGITDLEPTNITLHLVDHSVIYPIGAIKDLLVNMDKFLFPTNFVILDIEADEDILSY